MATLSDRIARLPDAAIRRAVQEMVKEYEVVADSILHGRAKSMEAYAEKVGRLAGMIWAVERAEEIMKPDTSQDIPE